MFSYLIVFLFGLAVGSFLNCFIYRLEIGQKFLTGRSFCPHCKHILSWQDLIPVFSFIFLRGKCRYCRQKISWQYPLVELATGILFVLSVFLLSVPSILEINSMGVISSIYYLVVICFLIIIFVYDLKHYIIPDKVVYPAIVIAFLYQLFGILNFEDWDLFRISDFGFGILKPPLTLFLSAILASLFFLAIVLISRGKWMGMGDVKLAFFMGLFLGWPNILVALFLAFFIGAIIGIGLIIFGKKTLKSEVPFGPFLVVGTLGALFYGNTIISWYLSFIT